MCGNQFVHWETRNRLVFASELSSRDNWTWSRRLTCNIHNRIRCQTSGMIYNKQQCSVKHNNHIVCYLLTLGDMFRFPWNHHQALSEKIQTHYIELLIGLNMIVVFDWTLLFIIYVSNTSGWKTLNKHVECVWWTALLQQCVWTIRAQTRPDVRT